MDIEELMRDECFHFLFDFKAIDLARNNTTLHGLFVAGGVGFEPTTTNLGGWCSVRTELPAQGFT